MFLTSKVDISKWLPFIKMGIKGSGDITLPDDYLLPIIRDTLKDFCKRTGMIVRAVPIDLQCGVSEYPIELGDCETPIRIAWLMAGDGYQYEGGGSLADGYLPSPSSPNMSCWQYKDGLLALAQAPSHDCEKGLYAHAVAVPSHAACEVDEILFEEWKEAINYGVFSRLYLLPNESFTSPQIADLYEKKFKEQIGRASAQKMKRGGSRNLIATGGHYL